MYLGYELLKINKTESEDFSIPPHVGLDWTELKEPDNELSKRQHIYAKTPIGPIVIEYPDQERAYFSIEHNGSHISVANNLEEAKYLSFSYLCSLAIQLCGFVMSPHIDPGF